VRDGCDLGCLILFLRFKYSGSSIQVQQAMVSILRKVSLRSLLLSLCSFAIVLALSVGFSQSPIGAQESPPPDASPSPAASSSPTPRPTTSATPAAKPDAAAPGDSVEAFMSVLTFDPIKGEVDARLEFIPRGSYRLNDTDFPAKNLLLTVNSVEKQGSQITFKKGKPMDASSVKFTTVKGDVNDYPFDRHTAEVFFSLETAEGVEVPLTLNFFGKLPGYDIDYNAAKDNAADLVNIDVNVVRSGTTKFFSIVVMATLWVLALLSFLVAVKVAQSGKLPEIGMLGWMAALLFASPAVRNTQPNVPPVGTISDTFSLLLTETLVVIGLLILGICWLRRYDAPAK
jgi:hypothetical protein